ncbi:MAG TPA: efflux RND transporter periplasmic adaptor subunit [Gemmataceae bacterium]|nr:efflux RND transporter periplasmic adaptor subunit [Gemmataceae bacterium]
MPTVAAGALLLLAAIGGTSWYFLDGLRPARADLITHRVSYGTLQLTIVERGTLESANNVDVYCRVKTGTAGSGGLPQIRWVIPDGTLVKKGDLLMEIEDSRFEDQLQTQKIVLERAKSDMLQAEEQLKIQKSQNDSDIQAAELAIELAKLELEKFKEGDYLMQLRDIEGRLKMAESDLQMWLDRAAWAERMVMKGYQTASQAKAEQAKAQSAEINRQKILEERRVLEQYTKKKTESELKSKIAQAEQALARVKTQAAANLAKAQTDWETKKSVYAQELKRYQDLEQEIAKCKIYAPQDGLVVYYIPESGGRSSSGTPRAIIAQGETVWEGQRLMRIPDLRSMVVNTKVHEALISRVRVGQEAQIRVEAFPDRVLKGRVKSVANVAAKPDGWSSTDVKVYQTYVEILDEFDGLRPDMSAEVTIFTDSPLKNVLIVPEAAVFGSVQMGKYRKVFVMTPDGPEEREVVAGLSNGTHVEIKEGLKEGEEVVVNPRVLLGERERTRPLSSEHRSDDERPANGPPDSPNGPKSYGEPGAGPPGAAEPGAPPKGPQGKGSGKKGGGKKGPPVDLPGH